MKNEDEVRKKLSKQSRKTLQIAGMIFANTKKAMQGSDIDYAPIPVITFEELGVDFQHPSCLDLRNYGFVHLNSINGRCGVSMERSYLHNNFSEFFNIVRNKLT